MILLSTILLKKKMISLNKKITCLTIEANTYKTPPLWIKTYNALTLWPPNQEMDLILFAWDRLAPPRCDNCLKACWKKHLDTVDIPYYFTLKRIRQATVNTSRRSNRKNSRENFEYCIGLPFPKFSGFVAPSVLQNPAMNGFINHRNQWLPQRLLMDEKKKQNKKTTKKNKTTANQQQKN